MNANVNIPAAADTFTATLTLPATFTIRRQGINVTLPLGSFPAHILESLVMHGATQKIGDAAAGAKDKSADADMSPEAWAEEKMVEAVESLVAGVWGRERSGIDSLDVFRANVVRGLLKVPANKAAAQHYKGIKAEKDEKPAALGKKRLAFLLSLIAGGLLKNAKGNLVPASAIDAAAAERMAEAEAKAAAEQALYASLGEVE